MTVSTISFPSALSSALRTNAVSSLGCLGGIRWVTVLTKRFRDIWDLDRSAAMAFEHLPPADRGLVQHLLDLATGARCRILVRSNSPKESGASGRGIFRSVPTTSDIPQLYRREI